MSDAPPGASRNDCLGSDAVAERRAAIAVTNRRARAAVVAVGFLGALNLVKGLLSIALWPGPTLLVGVLSATLWLVAVVLYCRWLYRAYEDNRRLDGPPLRNTPGQAIASFFIPVVNLYRPYQVVRDLYVSSDPHSLPNRPQYRPAPWAAGYRSSALEEIEPPNWKKWCSVGLWWVAYGIWPVFGGGALGIAFMAVARGATRTGTEALLMLNASVGVASTVLAIQVILAIQARQNERLRRLEIQPANGEAAASSAEGVRAAPPPVRISPASAEGRK